MKRILTIHKKSESISSDKQTLIANSITNSTQTKTPFLKGNIGLWYYRIFFGEYHKQDASFIANDKMFAPWLQKECNPVLEENLYDYTVVLDSFSEFIFYKDHDPTKNNYNIHLKTIYPGLVCGIGYEHELGFENEFKLGFSFDHTTGLPYIPGSSVKGTLRSAFKHKGYPKSILEEWIEAVKKPDSGKSCPVGFKNKVDDLQIIVNQTDWEKLEDHIFEGKNYSTGEPISVYRTDVFFDAFISNSSEANGGKFLADDYITCHQNRKDASLSPFTNPNPVRFLKVRSDVEFTFGFRLFDIEKDGVVIFSSEFKKELFKQILLDLGIGAKTNVGYGQFEAVKDLPTETFKEEKGPDGLSKQNEV